MTYPDYVFQTLPQSLSMQEICNPYSVIEDFFSNYDLPRARHDLDKWFRSAFAQKSRLGKKESLSLLDLREHLIRLLEAAQLLNDDSAYDEKALQLTANDAVLMNTALYYNPCKNSLAWECFPRYLSRTEYANPYIVFEKCLGQLDLNGWRKFLKNLFYAATYDIQVNEAVNDDDLYYTCKCLFKLVEACHLVKVRDIDSGHLPVPAEPGPAGPILSGEEVCPANTGLKAA
jgi:hypothetical protein